MHRTSLTTDKLIAIILLATFPALGATLSGCERKEKAAPGEEGEEQPAETAEPGAKARAPAAPETPESPEGWLVVEQEVWLPVADDVGEELRAARRAFAVYDNKEAAAALHRGAEILASDLPKIAVENRDEYRLAIRGLERMADRLEKGETVPRSEFYRSLVAAHRADVASRWPLLGEAVWTAVDEQLVSYAKSAYDAFTKEELDESARDIGRVGALLRLEIEHAPTSTVPHLAAAAHQLDALAWRVDMGAIKRPDRLARGLAGAHAAVADSRRQQAEILWERKQPTIAGSRLQSAIAHLERSITWSGEEASEESRKMLRDAHSLADKLAKGKGYDPAEVGMVMTNLNQEIMRVTAMVEPPMKMGHEGEMKRDD